MLALLCLALTFWLFFELLASPPQFEAPKVTLVRHSAQVKVAQFVPPPIEAFAIIDDRSVFNPLRQKILSPREAKAQERPPPAFVLAGVILSSTARIAITKAPGANDSVNVMIGQSIDGWEVTAIETDHIDLRDGPNVYTLPLRPKSGSSVQAPLTQPQEQQPPEPTEPMPSPNP